MRALDIKLWRDLRLMWSQALTIALVVASGIGGFLTSLSAVNSLQQSRDAYYVQAHFADLFANLKRAPLALAEQLRTLPGVADVQPGIEQMVRIRVPGSHDPVLGQLIGLDAQQPRRLNQVQVVAGRALSDDGRAAQRPDGALPALVSQGFARARGLRPGDTVQALMNGHLRTLQISGIALSPEYIFAGLFGSPDQRGFGVFWLDADALAAAYDMHGAFNTLAVRLAPGGARRADGTLPAEQAAIRALAVPLARYGGETPRGRADQASHAMLDNEIKTQRLLGTVLPAIFLAVAAFLMNVVVSRLVATQREQIAALKALGYANRAIAAHYLKLVSLIVAAGALLGVALGRWLGGGLLGLFAQNFHFPRLQLQLDPGLVLLAVGLTLGAAVAGTLSAILATVRLSPAAAMRPPAPGHYRPTLAERLGVRGLSPALRMVLRNLERKPWRSTVGVLGVAAALAIVVMGNFFRDAIGAVLDTEFVLKMRQDVSLWLVEPADVAMAHQIARLDGVLALEPTRFVSVTLRHGHRAEQVQLRAGPAQPQLYRIIDLDGRAHGLHGNGLVLTDRLAEKLGVRAGQLLQLELNTGRRRTLALPVDALVAEPMGLNAYMSLPALNRAMLAGEVQGGFAVKLLPGQEEAFLRAMQDLPRVAGAFSKANMLRNTQEVTQRNLLILSGMLTLFACVIAVGVVYNNARIALAERAWELASLRVLGFTQREVSLLLLGEQALLIALALPLGMLLGWAMVHGTALALRNDQFHFPAQVLPRTYALAALAVLLAAAGSAAVVRRRIRRIDMVCALKTRE